VLCPFNVQNKYFCGSIRNCIAYANEENIVNKGTPICSDVFQLQLRTLFMSMESFSFTFEIAT